MNINVITKGVANLAVKRFLGPFWVQRNWLAKTQWFDEDKLRQIQLERLKNIISHSYKTVPYYKKMMDEYGVRPESIGTLDDIKKIPVLSKRDVLEAEESMISNKYPRWALRAARTGGSTGAPLVIYRNFFSIGYEHAFARRQWDWAGIKFSDRCAYLMSRVVVRPGKKNGQFHTFDPVMKDLILSSHHLSKNTAKQYVQVMKEYNIKAIVGYPSAINLIAKVCLEDELKLDLKAILTTSEMLTNSMRMTVEKAFDCKVFDFYGSAERVCYIHTCNHGNYHVIPEYGLTELVPIENSVGNYKVIATGFWNYAMPLIRYDTGDIVTKSEDKCPCQRQFQVIKSIDGRDGDVIATPSGKQLGVTLMIQILYVICGSRYILESQIVQDRVDHVIIKYVPHEKFAKKDIDDFRCTLSKYLPNDLKFDIKQVNAVEKTISGKVRPLVSLIK